jgi:hypothetical protein
VRRRAGGGAGGGSADEVAAAHAGHSARSTPGPRRCRPLSRLDHRPDQTPGSRSDPCTHFPRAREASGKHQGNCLPERKRRGLNLQPRATPCSLPTTDHAVGRAPQNPRKIHVHTKASPRSGRKNRAQGVSPGNRNSECPSPRSGRHHFGRGNLVSARFLCGKSCRPLRGLVLLPSRVPGLTPWAGFFRLPPQARSIPLCAQHRPCTVLADARGVVDNERGTPWEP